MLFFGGSLLFALPTAYLLGRTARSVTAIPFFGPVASAVPVVLVLLAVLRTLERIGSIEAEALVLTTVHPRAVVLGLITAEIGRLLLWFGLPLGAFAAAFALGLEAPTLVVTGGLVALPLICCAAVWGYAGGLGILRLLRHLPVVRRLLKVGGVLVMVGLVVASQFVGQYIVEADRWIQWLLLVATYDPLIEYVALAFTGTPLARPASIRSIAVLGAMVVLTPIGLAVATKQASTLWLTDAPAGNTSNYSSVCKFLHTRSHDCVRSDMQSVANATIGTQIKRRLHCAAAVRVDQRGSNRVECSCTYSSTPTGTKPPCDDRLFHRSGWNDRRSVVR